VGQEHYFFPACRKDKKIRVLSPTMQQPPLKQSDTQSASKQGLPTSFYIAIVLFVVAAGLLMTGLALAASQTHKGVGIALGVIGLLTFIAAVVTYSIALAQKCKEAGEAITKNLARAGNIPNPGAAAAAAMLPQQATTILPYPQRPNLVPAAAAAMIPPFSQQPTVAAAPTTTGQPVEAAPRYYYY
jgi:hypothetical protein